MTTGPSVATASSIAEAISPRVDAVIASAPWLSAVATRSTGGSKSIPTRS
jgi:hypothetical protein